MAISTSLRRAPFSVLAALVATAAISAATFAAEEKGWENKVNTSVAPTAEGKKFTREELKQGILGFFTAGDPKRLAAILPQDFVLRLSPTLPYGGEHRGPEGFMNMLKGTIALFESFKTQADPILDAGDYMILPIRITAKSKIGREMKIENLWLFKVSDGRLVSATIYADSGASLAATGYLKEDAQMRWPER
ncbi:nuclear transport factor 2 family protein [Pseudorhodoplanes sp.]|uniref:nuclear transport factor 2 family protein n=1 Tax=Pseudorhodoplanes sp. TaxID=1934341 RepID=UPI003D0CB4AA